MFRYTSCLSLILVLIWTSQIEAAPEMPAPRARMNFERQLMSLEHRQTSSIPDVPSQCVTICNPVNAAISSGCPATTCCQTSFEMGYFNCFQCFETAINSTDFGTAQQVLDELVKQCATSGFSLPKLTFPGQNPNRTLSSAGPTLSSSQTSAISQTTIFTATPTPPLSQTTVTTPPSTSPSPAPTTASGIKSVENGRLGLGIVTVFLGACFYLGL